MVRFAVALIAGIFLAGCEAKVDLPHPRLTIGSDHHNGGGFCPPGHRKKGNC